MNIKNKSSLSRMTKQLIDKNNLCTLTTIKN